MSVDGTLLWVAAVAYTCAAVLGIGAHMKWMHYLSEKRGRAVSGMLISCIAGYGVAFVAMVARLVVLGETAAATQATVAVTLGVVALGLLMKCTREKGC